MKIICDGGITSCNIPDTTDAIMLSKNLKNVDGVKLDVRLSKDNYLVLSRYDDLSIFTLCNKHVSLCDYNYLRKVHFNSHIFKYFIPTLEEILQKYNDKKIIVLELYPQSNLDMYFSLLYDVLVKYPYSYYYISHDEKLMDKLKSNRLLNLGEIIDNNLFLITNY